MKNVALITGASSGIGKELARIHAERGGDLVIVARSAEKLSNLKTELEEEHAVKVIVMVKDLSNIESPREIYDELRSNGVEVEMLFNNAGFGDSGYFHETDWEKESQMINVNIRALTELTKLFGKDMVKRKTGKILNMSSTAAFQAGPLMSIYYATKHYVLAFSEGVAREWEEFGVTVTAFCPGPTASGFQSTADIKDSRLVNLRKLPSAREVAKNGYQSLMKGRTVVIHGTLNKFTAFAFKFLPRSLVTGIVKRMHRDQS